MNILICLGVLACMFGLAHPFKGGKTLRQLVRQARNQGSRVSHKECAIDAIERLDCGHYGITQDECYGRECCWTESNLPGVPWCYHSTSKAQEVCTAVMEHEREDCGYYGIKSEECLGNKCCWLPTQVPNTPWCFFPNGPMTNGGGCGTPAIPPAVISRIVGGENAIPHSWPWQVSLQGHGSHYCGGSLIAPGWAITAAHCGPSTSDKVVLGLQTRSSPSDVTIEVGIQQTFMHEDYNSATTDNDILLMKLDREVEYSSEISPVCLPENRVEFPEGTDCYTTGWGTTSSGGSLADTLQQVLVPIISRDTCNLPDWYDGRITENMVCAGLEEGGVDSCQGDSGGPLVCSVQGHWILSGLTSWGFGCADRHNPGLYTNVAIYIDWIEDIMANN